MTFTTQAQLCHYCKLLCLLCTVPDVTRSLVITKTVSGSMHPTSTFPPPAVGGGPSTQVSEAIIGTVVAAVVVLVGGSVVVAASLIAWKVRSTKASTGMHCTVVHICLCGIIKM